MEKIICKNCGDIFEDYKSNKKKFCSKKCYYESIKNKIPWNLGKKYKGKPRSEETKKKIGEKNKISLLGNIPWNKGKSGLQVARNKGLKGFMAGNKHYNWNGGQDLIFTIRNCFEYRQWRSDIFTRDNFTCQDCGDNSGGNLNAHHKKRFIDIINQYNIKTIESALACNELWNINNGITLCEKCHRKVIN